MTAENKSMPGWAQRERQVDLNWIRENADVFHLAAKIAFQDTGRDAIVVDTTTQPVPGAGNPFGYFDQEFVREELDEDTQRMVEEYDPEQEVVLVLLKPENRTSTYRIRSQPSGDRGDDKAR
jgi:hypothetical protein